MEFSTGDRIASRCSRLRNCKRASPQTRGDEGRSGTLTKADQKLAPAQIDRMGIDELRWFPGPLQNVPRRFTRGTETNIRDWAVLGFVGLAEIYNQTGKSEQDSRAPGGGPSGQ